MMKKIISGLAIAAIILTGSTFPSFADESTQTTAASSTTQENVNAGITPDSVFYGLDRALEKLRLLFASGDKKAELLINMSEERIAEAQKMESESKDDLAVNAAKESETEQSEALDIVEQENSKDSKSTEQIKMDNVAQKLQDVSKNSIAKLQALYDKLPDNAKAKIAAVIEKQTQKHEAITKFVEARHELNADKKKINELKNQLKGAEQGSDEANAIQADIDKVQEQYEADKQNVSDAKQAFKSAKPQKSVDNQNNAEVKKQQTDTTAPKINSKDSKKTTTAPKQNKITVTSPASGQTTTVKKQDESESQKVKSDETKSNNQEQKNNQNGNSNKAKSKK